MDQTVQNQTSTAWPPRRVALATLAVLAVVAAFYILFRFRLVFFSLFIAIVLSTAIEPLIARLSRLGIPRQISIIVIFMIVLALIAVLILAVAPLISEQWVTISNLVSNWYQVLQQNMMHSTSLIIRRIALQMPVFLPTAPPPAPSAPASQPAPDLAQQALVMGSSILRSVVVVISVLLLTALWILEGDIATRFLLLSLPQRHREPARAFLGDIEAKVGAYTRGLVLLNVIMGVLAGIAYWIVGLPNVLLLGVFAGVMEIVPLIGPALGAVPALLVAASTDPQKVIWVLVAYLIVHALESNVIVPRVMDQAVGVNPVVSLLAFIAFGSIFGFVGALLAVPLAAVIQLVLNRFVFNVSITEQVPPSGRSVISTLRYEAQDLVVDVRKQIRGKESEVTAREDRIEDAMESIAADLDSLLAQAEPENVAKNKKGRRQ